jgi:hypothetical protein
MNLEEGRKSLNEDTTLGFEVPIVIIIIIIIIIKVKNVAVIFYNM